MDDPYRSQKSKAGQKRRISKGSRFVPGEGCVTRECLVFWMPLVGSVSFLVVLVAGYWILVSVILGFPGLIAGAIFKILNQ